MTVGSTTNLSSLFQLPTTTGTASSATTGATTSGATGTSAQSLSQTFLQLLVAQMNNQDPLNPVDNSQITSQMAQISTVTGISSLNTTVSQLVSQLQQSQTVQSTQMTGHTVLVPGNSLTLAATSSSSGSSQTMAAYGGFSLPQAADSVSVAVKDSTGATVRTINLGSLGAGVQDFSWNGATDSGAQAAAGNYTYSVTATAAGKSMTATPYSAQQVVGLAPQSDGSVQFLLSNGTQVGLSSIAQIM
jgi:flagellar basal-body rod modification protein FlgD